MASKSLDEAKIQFEVEAGVSSEIELRPAVEAVKMKAKDERLQAELALRAEQQHRAWKERRPWHVESPVFNVPL